MSRSSRSRSGAYRQTGRETNVFARRSLPLSDVFSIAPFVGSPLLRQIEDRRTWHPEGVARPARSFTSARHRLIALGQSSGNKVRSSSRPWIGSSVPFSIGFADARRVLVCVRRRQRRQVLHAKRIAGRRGLRPPRYNYYSGVSCR